MLRENSSRGIAAIVSIISWLIFAVEKFHERLHQLTMVHNVRDCSAPTHNIDEEWSDHASDSPWTRSHSESQVSATVFSARCNIYISRLCYDASPSVRLSVTEVHWRIRAKLGFKFRSHFTARCGRRAARRAAAVLLAGESSRALLTSARLSCLNTHVV